MTITCTPLDIFELARQLAEAKSEAAKRAAINRAYYAAYHAIVPCAALVPGADLKGPQGGLTHRELPRRLRDWRFLPTNLTRLKPLASKARVASDEFSAAISVREIADYSLSERVDDSMVRLQLQRMQVVLNFATEVQAELARLCA